LTVIASVVAVVPALALADGAPDHLGFDTQPPATVTAGQVLSPAVTVDVLDSTGALVTGSTASISLTLSGGNPSASLGGTTTVDAVGGVATFDTLTVDLVGTGYALTAESDPLTPAVSDPFDVTAGSLDHLVLSPADSTIPAGGSQDYSAEGFDAEGNDLGDVTADTTFTIEPTAGGASCTGATCTANTAGDYTITGTDGTATGQATLHVTSGTLDHLILSPADSTIMAGGSQDYTAEGYDAGGNDLGDVTADTTFTISPHAGGASCTGATCTANLVGDYMVSGVDNTVPTARGTAILHVRAGTVATITISPDTAAMRAGDSQSYTAEAFDSEGNDLGDVTADTTFTIDSGSGGSCTGADCTAIIADTWTVTGDYSGITDSASLQVRAAPADHLAFIVQPGNPTAGQILDTVKVAAEDPYGNIAPGTTGKVFLEFGNNPSGALLAGTNPRSVVDGVATFNDLIVNKAGIGFTLVASYPALDPTMRRTSSTFDVKGPVGISLTVDRKTISAGQTVHLTAHLGHWYTNRTLSIYATPYGGTKKLVASGEVGSGGRFFASSQRYKRTTFVAEYTGDSRYLPETSKPVVVQVHVVTNGSLSRYYGSSGGYRLFHYHSSCPGPRHKGCPPFTGTVAPNEAGEPLGFTLQAYSAGSWHTVSSAKESIDPDGSKTIVWIYAGQSVKGIPLRCRASYSGDASHLGDAGPWRYFKVTS
jgi:hypothetical protein